ncbi:MAG: TRAP transporter large permease subunit, partial [Proteobacteria bacterium]|nr:TRAP transporter large permease subunit [Pseudomonadota bacterium]
MDDDVHGALSMKICLIGNAQAVHLQRWAGAYEDRGHDVHVVSIRACNMPNITVHTRNVGQVNTTSPVWTALSYLWLTLGVRRLVGSIDPDVVHAQFVTTSGVMARVSGNDHVVLTAWGSDVIPPHGSRHSFIVRALNSTVRVSGMIFLIVIGAMLLNRFITITQLPSMLASLIADSGLSTGALLLLVVAFYLIMGCLMDAFGLMMLTMPILIPIMRELGVDLVMYGILMILMIEMAQITPPIGIN